MKPRSGVFSVLLSFVLLLFFACCLNAAAQAGSEKARHELKLGVEAYKDGRYEAAAEHFENAVQFDDHLAVVKLDLAHAYAAMWVPGVNSPDNNLILKKAMDAYNSILAADPKNSTALSAVAYLCFGAHRFGDSREYLKRWIEADPNDADAYYTAAVVDWASAYMDISERRRKFGLKTPGLEKQPTGPQSLCEQVKAADGAKIAEGLNMAQAAMEKRAGYRDAMLYATLLYRLKAVAECNPQAYARDNALAETFNERASKTEQPAPEKEKPLGEDEVPSFAFPPPPPPPPPHAGKKGSKN